MIFYQNEKIEVYIYITAKSNIYYEINNGKLIDVMSILSKSSYKLVILMGVLLAFSIYYFFSIYFYTK